MDARQSETEQAQSRQMSADPTHQLVHGQFEIQIISDGQITLPAVIVLPDTLPDERPDILKRLGGGTEGAPFALNIPLIKTDTDLILIDNGSGNKFQDSAGRLRKNLDAAGVDPRSVTKVIFTHIHPDHAGGTILPDGELLCPDAQYYVSEAEWRFWMDADYESSMPAWLHEFARGSQRDMTAIADRVTLFEPDREVVSGVNAISTPGHTPGHVSLELAGGDGLIICGDVSTSNVIFFEHPNWRFGFDTDQTMALKTRRSFLDRVAYEKPLMLGFHWAYPGLGFAERRGAEYRFVAA